MTQPSNSNLIGPGQITITPDPQKQVLGMEIHFVTIHLQPIETKAFIKALIDKGRVAYGVEWGEEFNGPLS